MSPGREDIPVTYSDRLVQRVNELYHDAINERYHEHHPEILEQEKERWLRLARQHLTSAHPAKVLDIGTGTGFVPLTIAPLLGPTDTIICSDISRGILDAARRNLEKEKPACDIEFVKLEVATPYRLPLPDASVDVVTINSVLHHVADTEDFLMEVDRVLRAGGLVLVAHEPNRRFRRTLFLQANYALMYALTEPKLVLFRAARRLRLDRPLKALYYRARPGKRPAAQEYESIMQSINETVLAEALVSRPLRTEEIEELVDIRDREGFTPGRLMPGYELLHLETYNHMLWVTIRHQGSRLVRRYESWLGRRYPAAGATFFTVLRKGSRSEAGPGARATAAASGAPVNQVTPAKVLLIYPSSFPDVPGADIEVEQYPFLPNGVLCLGSFLKSRGHEVRLIDCRLYPKAQILDMVLAEAPGCTCVGISAMTGQLRHGMVLAESVRTVAEVPLVWGGIHPTLFPEQTLADPLVDYIIHGEAEYSFLELLDFLAGRPVSLEGIEGLGYESDGGLVVNPPPAPLDVTDLPDPDYSLLEIERYIEREVYDYAGSRRVRGLDVHTSRGCPYRCSFCTNILPAFKKWRAKDANRVLADLDGLAKRFDLEHIWFSDDFFFGSRSRVRTILEGMVQRGLGVTWEANARVDNFRPGYLNDEMLGLLAESGCTSLRFGVESGSQPVLDILRKDITPEQAVEAFTKCEKQGIVANGFLMIGIPGETIDDIRRTIGLILRLHEVSPSSILGTPGVFRPYPGTELYEECRRLGFREPTSMRQWAEYDFGGPASNLYLRAEDLPWVDDPRLIMDLGHYLYWYLVSEAVPRRLSPRGILGRIAGWRLKEGRLGLRWEPALVRAARRIRVPRLRRRG